MKYVFISYCRDENDTSVKELLTKIALELVNHGICPITDQNADLLKNNKIHAQELRDEIKNIADESQKLPTPQWIDKYLEKSDKVLILVTELFARALNKPITDEKGKGISWEYSHIVADLYATRLQSNKYAAILNKSSDENFMPWFFRIKAHFHIEMNGLAKCITWINNKESEAKSNLCSTKTIAGQQKSIEFLNTVIEPFSRDKILGIHGQKGSGKTLIIRHFIEQHQNNDLKFSSINFNIPCSESEFLGNIIEGLIPGHNQQNSSPPEHQSTEYSFEDINNFFPRLHNKNIYCFIFDAYDFAPNSIKKWIQSNFINKILELYPNFRLIITAEKQIDLAGAKIKWKKITAITSNDWLEYLKTFNGQTIEKSKIDDIIRDCHEIPGWTLLRLTSHLLTHSNESQAHQSASSGQTDIQKSEIIIEFLETLPQHIKALVIAACVPHCFNKDILMEIFDEKDTVERHYEQLTKLPIIERPLTRSDLCAASRSIREYIVKWFSQSNKDQFILYSERSARYFVNHPSIYPHEDLYHRAIISERYQDYALNVANGVIEVFTQEKSGYENILEIYLEEAISIASPNPLVKACTSFVKILNNIKDNPPLSPENTRINLDELIKSDIQELKAGSYYLLALTNANKSQFFDAIDFVNKGYHAIREATDVVNREDATNAISKILKNTLIEILQDWLEFETRA